ncbi:MAG: YbhB/YbcL family Raf kinase inhibitor-like protein [Candidatus Omnitrophica bacterium]|nr:YbhB/YbcL family Raf kinase inhibitor-like protein [Candidatus Omnitrophota bacterium]
MKIGSPAFIDNGVMPKKYTCDGEEINPPLTIEDIPQGAKSLALIVDDPDAPAHTWVHWVVFDIDVVNRIAENSIPGKQGANDSNPRNYGSPCPPSGTHRYFFKIYALDTKLGLKEGIRKQDLEEKMKGHILGQAQTVGLYKRQ